MTAERVRDAVRREDEAHSCTMVKLEAKSEVPLTVRAVGKVTMLWRLTPVDALYAMMDPIKPYDSCSADSVRSAT
jgi:hypothetical protein